MTHATDRPDVPDGSRHSLADNCVEYRLFLVESPEPNRKIQLSRLEELRKAALSLVKRITSGYIWQRDEFALELRHDHQLSYIHGVVNYGDSVEDEWLVVYLLRELTLSRPDLWVRVFDSDGEFLLIEAANALPPWLNPEMDTNRPWIHQGRLYIIPVDRQDKAGHQGLSLPGALNFIRTQKDALIHSELIESEAFYRLEKYPGHITSCLHRTLVTIPRKLAFILHENPPSISPAVEAFYLRDALDLKPILSDSSLLCFPPKDLVTVSVTFTRVLYAQVRSQRFEPPPRWASIVTKAADEIARARLEIGMKLTCGFEMMVGRLGTYDRRAVREVGIILEDLEEDGGDSFLPSDKDISQWKDVAHVDDDSWLDINFEDFERELKGRGHRGANPGVGFGDETTQAGLRKIVERFESFLNDESTGIDGAEVDGMDHDDEEDGETDSELSDDEDKAISFDQNEFARMMNELMGLPAAAGSSTGSFTGPTEGTKRFSMAEHFNQSDDEGLLELAAEVEAELQGYGVLKLDPRPTRLALAKDKEAGKTTSSSAVSADSDEFSDEGGEVDIDYNLAKNILESFKSQAGMAGPAGNILGMMGVQLPRDEDDPEDREARR